MASASGALPQGLKADPRSIHWIFYDEDFDADDNDDDGDLYRSYVSVNGSIYLMEKLLPLRAQSEAWKVYPLKVYQPDDPPWPCWPARA